MHGEGASALVRPEPRKRHEVGAPVTALRPRVSTSCLVGLTELAASKCALILGLEDLDWDHLDFQGD
jgi:hypothetical protein